MSFEWYRRAHTAIAQGSLTNSKRVETFIKGVTPTHATHGDGAYLHCIDGKRYIDYCSANGSSIFGYGHPLIKQAIINQMAKGWLFSLGSTLEVECAELVKGIIPFARKARFFKEGSTACAAAVKIARAHTGRDRVLSSGYHGWSDDFISLTPPALGVPKRSSIELLTSMDQIKSDVACVIIEPIVTDYSAKRIEWLQELIRKCKVNGTLVIFDEIITGFRWPKFSFSAWSGVYPDIICMGKACASGLPLAFVGLAEHVGDNKEWFISGTYHGELLSLAAMKETHRMMMNKYRLDDLWKDGQAFLDRFNQLHPHLKIEGYPTRGVFKGDDMTKALFFQETHKAQILFGPSWFYGFQHRGLNDLVLSTCADIFNKIKTGSVQLTGEMPSSPFAQKVREAS